MLFPQDAVNHDNLEWLESDKEQNSLQLTALNESLAALTSSVSHPPTMLSPKPTFPLQISMVVSLPATTGQLRGPEVVGDNLSQSDLSVKQVCVVLRDEEEEVTGGGWTESGEREP